MNTNNIQNYRFVCTLTFGDIYGQIIIWLITITISLASALALMGAKRPVYALATVGLVVLLSLHCKMGFKLFHRALFEIIHSKPIII